MRCPICHEEVASVEQAERWGPEWAHSRCVTAYNYGKADAAPAQASAVDERAAFEAWVTERGVAMHYEGDGHYGNATVARWWEAWQARAALAQKGGK